MPLDVFWAALLVFLLTGLGSLFAVIFKKVPSHGLEVSLAFSGGIMLVASFTSLILPSIEKGNIYISMLGITLGFIMIHIIENYVPHEEHFLKFKISPEYKNRARSITLIVLAIIIHNLPEGMAVGVSMINNVDKGWATAIAIGIQDIPEGLAVSLPLIFLTEKLFIPIIIGILSGFSEALFAIFGGLIFSKLHFLLPLGLSIAGGAMIYVTVKEVFPEVYKSEKNKNYITVGFLAGVLLMLYLDVSLS
jgi:ZIP family zinc transporter